MIVPLLDSGQSVKTLCHEYSLDGSMIRRWRKEYHDKARPSFTGNGKVRITEHEKEVAFLKKQLKDVTIERDILKKAVSIFSKSDRTNTNSYK